MLRMVGQPADMQEAAYNDMLMQKMEQPMMNEDGLMDEEAAKGQKRTSKYRGVCWNKKNRRWQASINVGGRYHYLGSFLSEDHAARAFDKAAYEIRGKRAKLNFPDSSDMYESGAMGLDPAIRPEHLHGVSSGMGSLGSYAHSDGPGSDMGDKPSPAKRQKSMDTNGLPGKPKRRMKAPAPLKGLEHQMPWGMDMAIHGQHPGIANLLNGYTGCIDGSPNALAPYLNHFGDVPASNPLSELLSATGVTPRGGLAMSPWGGLSPNVPRDHAPQGSTGGDGFSQEPGCPNLGLLFNGFGATASVLKLLPHGYNRYRLLGAVIENCRDTEHFGAAVWDGKRMHTLEGFQNASAAETSAIDVINMLSALQTGKPCGAPGGDGTMGMMGSPDEDNQAENPMCPPQEGDPARSPPLEWAPEPGTDNDSAIESGRPAMNSMPAPAKVKKQLGRKPKAKNSPVAPVAPLSTMAPLLKPTESELMIEETLNGAGKMHMDFGAAAFGSHLNSVPQSTMSEAQLTSLIQAGIVESSQNNSSMEAPTPPTQAPSSAAPQVLASENPAPHDSNSLDAPAADSALIPAPAHVSNPDANTVSPGFADEAAHASEPSMAPAPTPPDTTGRKREKPKALREYDLDDGKIR